MNFSDSYDLEAIRTSINRGVIERSIFPKIELLEDMLEEKRAVPSIQKALGVKREALEEFLAIYYKQRADGSYVVLPKTAVEYLNKKDRQRGWTIRGTEDRCFGNVYLHRVVLVRPYHGCRQGETMGWIEHEDNLQDEAMVFGEAKVYGNAKLKDKAMIFDKAEVKDNAVICGTAIISDLCVVKDNAYVKDAFICGNVEVCKSAKIVGGYTVSNDNIASKKKVITDEEYSQNNRGYSDGWNRIR